MPEEIAYEAQQERASKNAELKAFRTVLRELEGAGAAGCTVEHFRRLGVNSRRLNRCIEYLRHIVPLSTGSGKLRFFNGYEVTDTMRGSLIAGYRASLMRSEKPVETPEDRIFLKTEER